MAITRETEAYGSPHGMPYDPDVAKVQRMSVEKARPKLGQVINAAQTDDVHTVIARHSTDIAVVVPMDWYRRMRELDGDPTDL